MGVIDWIAGVGTKRVHVLVIETPGASLLRMRVQAAIAARGWVEATSPADADALLVCGNPGSPLSELIGAVWEQIPSPRHRAMLTEPGTLLEFLDAIPIALQNERSQRADAHDRPQHVSMSPADGAPDMTRVDTSDTPGMHHSEAEAEPPLPDDSGHDVSMHTDTMYEGTPQKNSGSNPAMDMNMSGPAGIPLAEGDQDRDGLEMDVTHLTLGPILAAWPADLVLHCTLHGDVVADARVERLPSGVATTEQPAVASQLCDAAARLLSVIGWDPVARQVDRLRNDIVSGVPPQDVSRRLNRLITQIRRSRTLRWSLAGIHAPGARPARDRLLGWLQSAQESLMADEKRPFHIPVGELALSEVDIRLAVLGQELSTVRLIIASLATGTSPRVVLGHE